MFELWAWVCGIDWVLSWSFDLVGFSGVSTGLFGYAEEGDFVGDFVFGRCWRVDII